MSTQDTKFPAVPFSLTEPLQHVRLLEVPEELLDIIVNTKQNLYFKSAAPTPHNGNGIGGKEGNLHLCTDDKVWAVKQVSTSNSIHVARVSSAEKTLDDGGADDDDGDGVMDVDDPDGDEGSGTGVSAFTKPNSILELHAVHPATYVAVVQEHLNTLIPTVSSVVDIGTVNLSNNYSLRELYDHTPAPYSVIQRVLAQNCVFELTRTGPRQSNGGTMEHHTYIPSPHLLLSTWTEIVNTAIMSGKDITNIEDIRSLFNSNNDPEMLDSTDDLDDNHIKSIHNAITSRLFDPTDGHLASLGILTKFSQKPTLNPRECTRWVGNLILAVAVTASNGTNQPPINIPKLIFEKDWEDRVPTDWIKYCSVEVLQPSCEVKTADGEEVVSWRPFVLEGDGAGKNDGTSGKEAGALAAAVGVGTAPTKNKRKWHEKFAAQRDAKK